MVTSQQQIKRSTFTVGWSVDALSQSQLRELVCKQLISAITRWNIKRPSSTAQIKITYNKNLFRPFRFEKGMNRIRDAGKIFKFSNLERPPF